MFVDLLEKADQKKQTTMARETRKKEILNLFKSLAEKTESELRGIFKTIKICDSYDTGNIIVSRKQKDIKWLSENEIYTYVVDICSYPKDNPYIYAGDGYNRYHPTNIPFKWDMTNAQLTIIYNNALRTMVSKALHLN